MGNMINTKISEEALYGRAKMNKFHFDVVDYCVFSAMLLLSAMTGLYYGCRGRYCQKGEEVTLRDYLTGSGNMRPFPVAMSLIASYVSGVTILGTPSEIYNFGTQYWLITFSVIFSGIAIAFIYLPVFFQLEVNSSYEYLEFRFSRTVRTLASVLFVIDEILFLPILIYVPSLAFNQVSGINLHLIGTIVTLVCIFYTVVGGLQAVVWTDTWQIIVMFISVVVVVVLGTVAIDGGFDKIWDRNDKGGRLIFDNFSVSLYERQSFFAVLFGGFTYWTSYNSVNQTMVQRYMSLPTLKNSRWSVALFTIGVGAFLTICCYSGLLIFATYYDCDPLLAGRIKADDQLLPLFVMETVGHLRGVPGLFIAGVFGAALSSLSVILNSTSMVFLEDFIKGCLRMSLPERTESIIVKVVVLFLGAVAVGFLFVVEHMGGVLSMAASLSGIAAGTTFGVFTLGMVFPFATNAGALIGGLAGALMSGWVAFGVQYVGAAGYVIPHKLPVSIEGCEAEYDIKINYIEPEYPDESNIFPLFRLSYHWITPVGVTTVLIVGILVSLLGRQYDLRTIDPDLISPISQWMLPVESKQFKGTAAMRVRRKQRTFDTLMQEIRTPQSTRNSPTISIIDSRNSSLM
ncbi:sodium-coupled monocarboxylate transporter 1 isoform X2 [Atheta coriaria]|uniref:sodium-coupled monocarboxylate transporter 1 isoform X2 n=1 Tax=Dalotia coriaria TaxID=877792 RepID=UPI0031F3ECE0